MNEMMHRRWILYGLLLAGAFGCGSSASPLFAEPEPGDAGGLDDAAFVDAIEPDALSSPDATDPSANVDAAVTEMPDAPRVDVAAESAAADVLVRPDAPSDSKPPSSDGAVVVDAPEGPDALCNRVCAGKGTCSGGECVIRCEEKSGCSARVECPRSVPCRVVCAGAGSCAGGVDCSQGTACDIQC